MINELAQSKGSVLAFEITGKITLEEENKWIKKFEERIAQHQKISVLIILGENASWGTKAGYEDIKWLFKHFKQFNKIAIVSDSKVWKWLITVDSQFAKLLGISEKHFQPTDSKLAWSWVSDEQS